MTIKIDIPSIKTDELQSEIYSDKILQKNILKLSTEKKYHSGQVKTRGGQEVTVALITGGFSVIVTLINLISVYLTNKKSSKDDKKDIEIKNNSTNTFIIIHQNIKKIEIEARLKDFPRTLEMPL